MQQYSSTRGERGVGRSGRQPTVFLEIIVYIVEKAPTYPPPPHHYCCACTYLKSVVIGPDGCARYRFPSWYIPQKQAQHDNIQLMQADMWFVLGRRGKRWWNTSKSVRERYFHASTVISRVTPSLSDGVMAGAIDTARLKIDRLTINLLVC